MKNGTFRALKTNPYLISLKEIVINFRNLWAGKPEKGPILQCFFGLPASGKNLKAVRHRLQFVKHSSVGLMPLTYKRLLLCVCIHVYAVLFAIFVRQKGDVAIQQQFLLSWPFLGNE